MVIHLVKNGQRFRSVEVNDPPATADDIRSVQEQLAKYAAVKPPLRVEQVLPTRGDPESGWRIHRNDSPSDALFFRLDELPEAFDAVKMLWLTGEYGLVVGWVSRGWQYEKRPTSQDKAHSRSSPKDITPAFRDRNWTAALKEMANLRELHSTYVSDARRRRFDRQKRQRELGMTEEELRQMERSLEPDQPDVTDGDVLT